MSQVKQIYIQLQSVSSKPARSSQAIPWSSLSWPTDIIEGLHFAHRSPPLKSKNLFWASLEFQALVQRQIFRRFRKLFEKQLLVSLCLSVCTSGWNISAPIGRSFMNYICKNCIKIWHENSFLFKIEQIYRVHYVKTYELFTFDIQRTAHRDIFL
jgi:hypothetical protein